MHKRFRKLTSRANAEAYSSNSSSESNVNSNTSFVAKKYARQKRKQPVAICISETSTDELHKDDLGEENRKWLPNLKKFSSDPNPLKLVQHNSYQPLSVSITAKSPSQTKPPNTSDASNCSTPSSSISPAACRAAYNSFRQTLTAINHKQKSINKSILDCTPVAEEANENLQRKRTFVSYKYSHQKRENPIELHISDTSSDEFHKDKLEEENRKRLSNLKRYNSDSKPLRLIQHNRYRSLSVSITSKSQSQTKPTHDVSNCSTEAAVVFSYSFGETVTPSNPNQETMNKSLLDCTPIISLEANLGRMVEKEQTSPKLVQKKQRCIKGGYLYEYKRVLLKECMDRRSLAQNQRLGISSGQRVQVLHLFESFGVKMAQVKPEYGEQDKGKFNVIISPIMAANISVGATLELYFDLKPETALKLPDNELVYVHPNKLVLL